MIVCVCRLLWSDCVRGLSEATDIVGLDVLIVNGIYGRPWSGVEIMEGFKIMEHLGDSRTVWENNGRV